MRILSGFSRRIYIPANLQNYTLFPEDCQVKVSLGNLMVRPRMNLTRRVGVNYAIMASLLSYFVPVPDEGLTLPHVVTMVDPFHLSVN